MTVKYSQQDEVNGLLRYINEAPTPYHSTEYLANMLDEAGAVRLKEEDPWGDILPGMLYYYTRNDSCIAAFRLADEPPIKEGWRIAAAHHDAPCLRIKPCGSVNQMSYERLAVEPYGGLITHTWLDRPLSLAGKIYTRSSYSDGISGININISRPLLVIPELAIHMNREVNDRASFNCQTDMLPFFCQDFDKGDSFITFIANEIGADEEDILSFDLMLYDSEPACLTGLSSEFVSAPRLDDYAMTYSIFRGFLESSDASSQNCIAVAFDHEECGSQTDRGAKSDLIESLLSRISEKLEYSREDCHCAMARSVILSADMAHAAHPSYGGKSDENHPVFLNKGIVLKSNYNQSYITSPRGTAYFKKLCQDAKIPFQEFVNRSDVRGGSTIGPMLASKYGALSIDVGSPVISMHAIRELGGALDVFTATNLFEEFYR